MAVVRLHEGGLILGAVAVCGLSGAAGAVMAATATSVHIEVFDGTVRY
jgi:hypothetical protein